MKLLVILLVLMAIGFIVWLNKRREVKSKKVDTKPVENSKNVKVSTLEKVDNAPYTRDSIIRIEKGGIYKITYKSLIFGDIDGDKVTNVKFYNFNKSLFLDKKLTEEYVADTELPIDFELFVNVGEDEEVNIEYSVKSNNKWSL